MFQASAIIVGNMLESRKIVNLNPCIVVGWVKEANFHFVESKHVQCRSLTLNQLIPFLFFSFLFFVSGGGCGVVFLHLSFKLIMSMAILWFGSLNGSCWEHSNKWIKSQIKT